jgi:hypothetical protein
MRSIRKKLVTDENRRPVEVIVKYEDWLEIERALDAADRRPRPVAVQPDTDNPPSDTRAQQFHTLAEAAKGSWTGEDGLDYQRRIRTEWDRE